MAIAHVAAAYFSICFHASPAYSPAAVLWMQGPQQREVVRVVVECSLAESPWNPYYLHLLTYLCKANHQQQITLKYCLWDQYKTIAGSPPRRSAMLGKLIGSCVAAGLQGVGVLGVAELGGGQLTPEQTVIVRQAVTEMVTRFPTVEVMLDAFLKVSFSLRPWKRGFEAYLCGRHERARYPPLSFSAHCQATCTNEI